MTKVVVGGCTVLRGDCVEVMRALPADSIDAVVTDPPAGIGFMSKSWDHDKGGRDHWIAWMREVAAECLRVAKPGAHALVWALPRTSHWTATAWEDAGWEVRDRVHFLHGVGFPKGQNVSAAIDRMLGAEREIVGHRPIAYADSDCWGTPNKNVGNRVKFSGCPPIVEGGTVPVTAPATPEAAKWQGWNTQLKPAVEDWWLLRKPLAEPTVAAQVLATGTGALNIDATRVPGQWSTWRRNDGSIAEGGSMAFSPGTAHARNPEHAAGRWPSNLVLDDSDEVKQAFAAFGVSDSARPGPVKRGGGRKSGFAMAEQHDMPRFSDKGSPARFFPALGFTQDELRFHYSAKANKRERAGSKHPCVKPQSLLRWLARLTCPPGGTILDPFAGSGSLGQAALAEGFKVILIEREEEYFADCIRRMEACRPPTDLFTETAA